MKPLEEYPGDARVWRPEAKPVDFAFNRAGTVIRDEVDGRLCLGVLWDGATSVFEYPGDCLFADMADFGLFGSATAREGLVK